MITTQGPATCCSHATSAWVAAVPPVEACVSFLQVAFVASFVSKLSDTVSSEIGKVIFCCRLTRMGWLLAESMQSVWETVSSLWCDTMLATGIHNLLLLP